MENTERSTTFVTRWPLVTMRPFVHALLVGLCAACEASAQTAQKANDFSSFNNGRALIVVDDSGKETRGRVLRSTMDSLTMTVEGRDRLFDRQGVKAIYELQGDSVRHGMMIGLAAGAALGASVVAFESVCGGSFEEARSCTGGEQARQAAVVGGVFGAIGMGIGTLSDALVRDRRLLYERSGGAEGPAISIVPYLAPSGRKLLLSVVW